MSKKTKAKTVRAALLDENGIYLGIDLLPEDQLTEHHLPHITECDLPPGQYCWHENAFVPIPKKKQIEAPDTERAIALGFLALLSQGLKLPAETRIWLKNYSDSFDFKGN